MADLLQQEGALNWTGGPIRPYWTVGPVVYGSRSWMRRELMAEVRRERADAARNRHAILKATESLLSEHPPEQVSMERIAAAAGVGKGTVFHRFGSRAGLMRELMLERAHALRESVTDGPRRWAREPRPGSGCWPSSTRSWTWSAATRVCWPLSARQRQPPRRPGGLARTALGLRVLARPHQRADHRGTL